jgi:o-succinylbenzoate synthase
MRVEAITLREIHMPLLHPFVTSFGKETNRQIILVEVHCEGLIGWGECVASEHPYYSEECVATAWAVMEQELIPAILGKNLGSATDCVGSFEQVRGNRMAKAALENALWEAESHARKLPLWKLLGGDRSEIDCGVSIGIQDSLDKLEEKVAAEIEAGYQRIKLKCKPGLDLALFERIRRSWPNILLSCDANSAYRPEHFDHLREFDRFNLLMIEQPLWHDDFYVHAQLQRRLKTRICLDEAIRNARDAQAAAELKACGIVNIKVGRVGGFTEAIAVHDVCKRHHIPVWCGGMLESGVGRAHNIALSTLENFTLPGDVSASSRYWTHDIIHPQVTVSKQGKIKVSNEIGTGYKVDLQAVDRLAVRSQVFRPQSVAV